MNERYLPAVLALVFVAAGCADDDEIPAPPTPPDVPGQRPPPHGPFLGIADMGDRLHSVEALITHDGAVRLHVGAGWLDPRESALFVGNVDFGADAGVGHGVIIGEACAAPTPGRFCDAPAQAEIRITRATETALSVEVRTTDTEPEELWLAEIDEWGFDYARPGYRAPPVGTFLKELAQFAAMSDVVITVDIAGQLFFQSPETGCTGVGSLAARPPGYYYMFDVTLTIAGCDTRYAFLNGDFDGLATEIPHGWDYDSWLFMSLSRPAGSPSVAAITMIGSAL